MATPFVPGVRLTGRKKALGTRATPYWRRTESFSADGGALDAFIKNPVEVTPCQRGHGGWTFARVPNLAARTNRLHGRRSDDITRDVRPRGTLHNVTEGEFSSGVLGGNGTLMIR